MNALLAQFIPEARDLLEQAGSGLLALERDAASQSAINDVFRAVHTLKGSSGLFELAPLTRLVHAAEDLLDEVRTGELALNGEIVDRLLDSLDVVGGWIDALEAHETLPADADAKMAARVVALRDALHRKSRDGLDDPSGDVCGDAFSPLPGEGEPPPAWLVEMGDGARRAAWRATSSQTLLAWTFTPETDCFFRGDDPVAMMQASPGLLSLRVSVQGKAPELAPLDPLACVLRFEALSETRRETLEEHMRYVADQVQIWSIAPRDLIQPTGRPSGGPVFADFAEVARRQIAQSDWDGLGRSIAALLKMSAEESFQASALRWCQSLLSRRAPQDRHDLNRLVQAICTGEMPSAADAASPQDQLAERDTSSGLEDCDAAARLRGLAGRLAREQMTVLLTSASSTIVEGRLDAVAQVLKNIAKALTGSDCAEPVDAALARWRSSDAQPLTRFVATLCSDEQAASDPISAPRPSTAPAPTAAAAETVAPGPPGADATPDARAINRVLRVDQTKIDSIMNLVAELIVAKNGLSYLATRAEQVHGARAVAREIKDQFAVIDRITQGLQVGVMSVRMMPVGQVFQRFPRLVRDVARKLGKHITLVIEGEETEADKNVLESLADPLIHMVRNSLDHGIETPEDRRAAGKPEQGLVRIIARQENDFVVIEVSDDGRGVDPNRVKTKAVALGLISAERAALLSDEDAANLVFTAGFSTKDEVSDLSGRGVGMDVVRTAVVRAGGDVGLRSTLGVGTSVRLRLPLTMAVTRIVTVECRGRLFGIPMDLVVETVRISGSQIHRIKTAETFVLRDAIVPIVRLAEVLGLAPQTGRPTTTDEAVMVVKLAHGRAGLIVDSFRERMEVIVKPLEGVLEGLPGFSGTALLGDGRVLLILDLKEII